MRERERGNCYTFLRKTGIKELNSVQLYLYGLPGLVFFLVFFTQVNKFLANGGGKATINDKKMKVALIFLTCRSQKDGERTDIDHRSLTRNDLI